MKPSRSLDILADDTSGPFPGLPVDESGLLTTVDGRHGIRGGNEAFAATPWTVVFPARTTPGYDTYRVRATTTSWHPVNDVCTQLINEGDYRLKLTRAGVVAASIDTRRGFGNPNAEGDTNPDVNWSLQNLNFSGYTWNGGLFLGNTATSSPPPPDRSGTARIQLYPNASYSSESTLFAALTLLDMGHRPYEDLGGPAWGMFQIAAYVAGSETQNVGTPVGTLTWANRLGIDPSHTLFNFGSPWTPNQHFQLSPIDFTNLDPGQSRYVTLHLSRTEALVGDPGQPEPILTFTPDFTNGILVAVQGEAGACGFRYNDPDTGVSLEPALPVQPGPTLYWRYFASDSYVPPPNSEFPRTDPKPRLHLFERIEGWGQ